MQLYLFSVDPEHVQEAIGAGIDGLVVDLERRGKALRQSGFDTEINLHTLDDLRRVRRATGARVICRVNSVSEGGLEELDSVVDAGADEILVPMVRSVAEVVQALELVGGRCDLGILVETIDAVREAGGLASLPLSRVYVGLNDLSIERGSRSLFSAVCDGTLARIQQSFSQPFGFGGLTLPWLGWPVPCRLLMAAMQRFRCDFTFLRRSFLRDVPRTETASAVDAIRAEWACLRQLPPAERERLADDLADRVGRLERLDGGPAGPGAERTLPRGGGGQQRDGMARPAGER